MSAKSGKDAQRGLRSYCADYLKEEIAAEALLRTLPEFSRFLELVFLMGLTLTSAISTQALAGGHKIKDQALNKLANRK